MGDSILVLKQFYGYTRIIAKRPSGASQRQRRPLCIEEKGKPVTIGDRVIGRGSPILIQSMTNTKTQDVKSTVAQIQKLEAAGCDIIRCAVPDMEAARALGEIKREIRIPLVADIHFDYRLAIAAIENGADKIRINPGNIGSRERVKAVVDVARERQIPHPGGGQQRISGERAGGKISRSDR